MRNPKSEYRNPKQYQNPNVKNSKPFWNFEFRILNLFRASNFEFRISPSVGFTLIEMAVATGVFAVLVVAAISVTIAVSRAQAAIQRIQTSIDNVRFSLELITKEMRVGSQYRTSTTDCGPDGGSQGILFMTSIPPRERYYFLQAGRLMRIKSPVDSDGNSRTLSFPADCISASPFTADEVTVDRFRVRTEGTAGGSTDGQPWVTINMKVTTKDPKGTADFSMDLQTSVVQRIRDFP